MCMNVYEFACLFMCACIDVYVHMYICAVSAHGYACMKESDCLYIRMYVCVRTYMCTSAQ